ncbi:MAG: ATP-binding cassette domain-containing protein [Clostridia bacterium]
MQAPIALAEYHTTKRLKQRLPLEDINLCVGLAVSLSAWLALRLRQIEPLLPLPHLQEPSSGNILIHSELLENKTAPVGYMFQHDQLLEWRTVFQCLFRAGNTKEAYKGESNLCSSLIRSLLTDQFQNHYPSQLSGGMRQRAALIRTMALKPEILYWMNPFPLWTTKRGYRYRTKSTVY